MIVVVVERMMIGMIVAYWLPFCVKKNVQNVRSSGLSKPMERGLENKKERQTNRVRIY